MSEPIQAQVTAIGEVMNAKIAELQVALTLATKRAEKAEAECDALRNIILWALGENGEFPERPRSDSHNLYPFYWWRTEMRSRLDAALAVRP